MIKLKPNLILGMGIMLFSITHIVNYYLSIPENLHSALMVVALAIELWGVILISRSPEIKNSKLRQWKLRLIGRSQK